MRYGAVRCRWHGKIGLRDVGLPCPVLMLSCILCEQGALNPSQHLQHTVLLMSQ